MISFLCLQLLVPAFFTFSNARNFLGTYNQVFAPGMIKPQHALVDSAEVYALPNLRRQLSVSIACFANTGNLVMIIQASP